jgi:hypothetical protein
MFDEFFLHYVWKHRLFDARNLKTMDGEELFIMDTGTENPLQGPDFMEGKIKIESKMWMGNIEIHVQASDWFRHSHQNDPVYQNVILHVVWSNDKPAIQVNGSKIPTIELRNRVFPFVLQNYKNLKESKKPIPCDPRWELIPIEKIEKQFFRTAEERLIRKSKEIETLLIREDWNWEMCFYKILVKSFGRSGNSSAFLQLAENLPLKLILKNRYDKLKTEALLFGQSG